MIHKLRKTRNTFIRLPWYPSQIAGDEPEIKIGILLRAEFEGKRITVGAQKDDNRYYAVGLRKAGHVYTVMNKAPHRK
ncbi:MAG: hypothetical protein BECKG1743E_GA0114224_113002 [Candidatus Kentron sp. G]|nr:MAG: hypothetical protein BECKG1743E_GA0114224_113002 [Candidatus Kentron sp. G]